MPQKRWKSGPWHRYAIFDWFADLPLGGSASFPLERDQADGLKPLQNDYLLVAHRIIGMSSHILSAAMFHFWESSINSWSSPGARSSHRSFVKQPLEDTQHSTSALCNTVHPSSIFTL